MASVETAGGWVSRSAHPAAGWSARMKMRKNRLRENRNFCEVFQVDLGRPVLTRKISRFAPTPNQWLPLGRPVSERGALRDRHGRWERDAMDVFVLTDEQQLT